MLIDRMFLQVSALCWKAIERAIQVPQKRDEENENTTYFGS
jgi:hypothetical protein